MTTVVVVMIIVAIVIMMMVGARYSLLDALDPLGYAQAASQQTMDSCWWVSTWRHLSTDSGTDS